MMGMMMPFSGMLDALMLIALAMGYVVLYLAKREDKALRTIGYIIGIFVIALSVLLLVVGLAFKAKACGKTHLQKPAPVTIDLRRCDFGGARGVARRHSNQHGRLRIDWAK